MDRDNNIEKILQKVKYDRYLTNPYAPLSYYPNILFVYLMFHYGWELYPPCCMLFLYNQIERSLKYASYDNRAFEEIGEIKMQNTLSIKSLFNCNPKNPPHVYDASYYELYIKSDYHERELAIQSQNRKLYVPFEPLLKIIDERVPC